MNVGSTPAIRAGYLFFREIERFLSRLSTWNAWGYLAAPALLAAFVLLFFAPDLLSGTIPAGYDTQAYYWPVSEYVAQEIRAGHFPLWTPYLLSGFPLYADPGAGVLQPIYLLLYALLPFAIAFSWLLVLRFAAAALFMYFFARGLQVSRFGSTIAAITFAFSGFFIGHLDHFNLANSAVWLPLVLGALERAFRSSGGRRNAWLVAAGIAHGMQWLGNHPQSPLMSILVIALYSIFRLLIAPPEPQAAETPGRRASLRNRVSLLAWVGLVTGGVAFGIAAVQILPMLELLFLSQRSDGLPYTLAAEYRLSLQTMITMIFPYFFGGPRGADWALWPSWELAFYIGMLPLLLGGAAIILRWKPMTAFLLFLALLGLDIAFANHSPLNLHRLLSELPGYEALRAPARYAYLFDLAWALLAGIGADAIRRSLPAPSQKTRVRFVLLLSTFAAIITLIGFLWGVAALDSTPAADVREFLQRFYVGRSPLPITAALAYERLKEVVNLDNARQIAQILILAWSALALALWAAFPRHTRFWQAILILTIVGDLFFYGRSFFPTVATDKLSAPNSAAQQLLALGPSERIYSWLYSPTDPNILLPFRLSEASGYTQARTQRYAAYAAQVEFADTRLLDLLGVRYIVQDKKRQLPSEYGGVPFNPKRPLVQLSPEQPVARNAFRGSDAPTNQIRVIAALDDSHDLADGSPVAEISLYDTEGKEYPIVLKAGEDVAQWDYERLDTGPPRHRRPAIAYSTTRTDTNGQSFQGRFYYATEPLPQSAGALPKIERVQFHYLQPAGMIEIYGLALEDTEENRLTPIDRFASERFQTVWQEGSKVIVENRSPLPRAFLVPNARLAARGEDVLVTMARVGFAPEKLVILEGDVDLSTVNGAKETSEATGTAQIVLDQPDRLLVEANAQQNAFLLLADTYYPGWKAFVDKREVPIYRADYRFRAVLVPAGQHKVEFVFRPTIFYIGLAISLATLAAISALAGLMLWRRLAGRRTSSKLGG
ncbi:MAG: YfhO family protein [Chloroflexi bacterium]|nr:YfhO family protein [Chloroflexota bacterium]